MNIVRALEVALPELPERIVRETPPKLDQRVISKQHIENGQPVVLVKMPGSDLAFRFIPSQWQLVQLFDGSRTYAEIAEQFQLDSGSAISEEEVQELAAFLRNSTPLLYKTPLERNISLQHELRSARKKRTGFRGLDFSEIIIKTWYNADDYITWLYPKVRFLFTPWFVWSSIAMFVVMGWLWADRFGEIWSDSFAFYNFTQKSGQDLIEFWFLFGAMAAFHETAHGLVGKHFGATVERMGFSLMYFAPSFFCDATQVWIIGGKWARIATAFAGIWLDLVLCFVATVIWWDTAVGMPLHDWAYKVMMVTGLGVSLLNLNPLIKLDGYLIFAELVAEPTLKESSTEYLSAWFRKHICRLPADVPYVPRRKRAFYVIYAILSGIYSYSLLSFLVVITYHILRSYTPEWAFLPAAGIGIWFFRSRITKTVNFMNTLYLDKKERIRGWFTPGRIAFLATAGLVLLFLPVWPDVVQGPVIVSAARTAVVRANVPAVVEFVSAEEGQKVLAGTLLLRLRNLTLESEAARTREELDQATNRATQAALRYTDFASAEQEREGRVQQYKVVQQELSRLEIRSPISGTLITAHTSDLIGRSVDAGDLLVQVADTSTLKAQVYIPEYHMRDVRLGQRVRFLVGGENVPLSGVLSLLSPSIVPPPDGLLPKEQLQGINPPRFFAGSVFLPNNGQLLPGMTGQAKVLVAKRSLFALVVRFGSDLAERKVW
jgi:putative peptide zinc metalloprotease protein